MRHKCYEESGDRRDGSAVKSMCFRRPEFAFQHSGQAAPNQRSLSLYIHTTPSHTCRHACTHPHKHAHTLTHMCIHTHTRTFKNTINLKRERDSRAESGGAPLQSQPLGGGVQGQPGTHTEFQTSLATICQSVVSMAF